MAYGKNKVYRSALRAVKPKTRKHRKMWRAGPHPKGFRKR